MPTRSSKHMDMNQLAKRILDEATGDAPKTELPAKAVRGAGGGKARAQKMTDAQRIDAARLAATIRWKKSS
jgi:hypothetical protein